MSLVRVLNPMDTLAFLVKHVKANSDPIIGRECDMHLAMLEDIDKQMVGSAAEIEELHADTVNAELLQAAKDAAISGPVEAVPAGKAEPPAPADPVATPAATT